MDFIIVYGAFADSRVQRVNGADSGLLPVSTGYPPPPDLLE